MSMTMRAAAAVDRAGERAADVVRVVEVELAAEAHDHSAVVLLDAPDRRFAQRLHRVPLHQRPIEAAGPGLRNQLRQKLPARQSARV